MQVFLLTLAGTAIIGMSMSAGQNNPAAPTEQGQLRTQWDGVYTAEQAKRGEPLYTKLCASCHGAELTGGDKAPPLVGDAFTSHWNDLKLGELSERMRTTMPVDNPASLTRAQNADVLAFMLQRAGASAGETDLPTNVDRLNAIKFVAQKPASAR